MRRRASQLMGRQRATMGASGVAADVGSAFDLTEDAAGSIVLKNSTARKLARHIVTMRDF